MMAALNTVISILAFLPHLDGCLGFQITNFFFFFPMVLSSKCEYNKNLLNSLAQMVFKRVNHSNP